MKTRIGAFDYVANADGSVTRTDWRKPEVSDHARIQELELALTALREEREQLQTRLDGWDYTNAQSLRKERDEYRALAGTLDAKLLRHMDLCRGLTATVSALDPAAADDSIHSEWDAAKWAVFNAAVRLVKESQSRTGMPVTLPSERATAPTDLKG